MSVTEVLQLMENLLQKHDGKNFEDLHKEIIAGLLQYKTYDEIAEGLKYDPEYVGTVSRDLYKILSKELRELGEEEKVKKSNFVTKIEKIANHYQYSFQSHNIIHNNKINFCPYTPQNCPQDINKTNITNSCYHNLKFAPKIHKFCDRLWELDQLSKYICNQNIPLISVLGLSGIGKSYLVKRFIDLNIDKFEVIIWQNLKVSKGLDEVINEVLKAQKSEVLKTSDFCQFFEILREKKCLIIFDNVEELFASGDFSGQFKPEFCEYQNFFKMMTEIEHQSSLIVISQEKCTEMNSLDKELYPVKCLELAGLTNTELLRNMGLKDEDCWLNLVNLYQGNPVYLQEICLLIRDFYDGKVSNFLAENTLQITSNMLGKFNSLFNRLSSQEKEVICAINKLNKPVSRDELSSYLNWSSWDLMNSLKSLKSRFLLLQIKSQFDLFPVFKNYVNSVIAQGALPLQ